MEYSPGALHLEPELGAANDPAGSALRGTFEAVKAVPEQFRSSAAPRGIWIGVRWEIAVAGAKKSSAR